MSTASSDRAAPTYSFLRTAVLSLTPGDLKCRLYCKGSACKFCNLFDGPSVVPGLYSTWITEDILAMARPQPVHFENDIIICHFKESNIVAVFNLEELGEHAYCGKGNLMSGFSYDPERFMRNNIFHYNFPLPDFEACIAEHMADIATVMAHELSKGNALRFTYTNFTRTANILMTWKIAVHCHAGHGRTGTAIAACLMRTRGLTPRQAVEIVRSKRYAITSLFFFRTILTSSSFSPSSVQSSEQVRALHSLHYYLSNTTPILPAHPFTSTSLYVEYTSRILPKMDMRQYGNVPKPLFVGAIALLHKCFISVNFRLETTGNQLRCFRFECDEPTSLE
ncbi:dual specificity phosphatase, catalytic domain protein [Ancylostoma caninum]|uniref:Dual specificity phosphatase, catalytic domain protein n=1 Tax=Ancylostoma caninum TaxID=29170 RepID=A0A368FDS0_ANCCA|nr:dual specificity phosphatase, catalytic domain protein [Ancylostoma caninum]